MHDLTAVKAWLNRGYNLDKEISTLLSTRAQLEAEATRVTQRPSEIGRVQASGQNSRETVYTSLADLRDTINRRYAELNNTRKEIIRAIADVDDSQYRTLLIQRYVCFRRWEQIAADMHYNMRYLCGELHTAALTAVAGIFANT